MSFLNNKNITKFLDENKPMSAEAFEKLKQLMVQEKQPAIHLYRMATFTKALFLVSRYQNIFLLLLGFTGYALYGIKDKYEQILKKIRAKDSDYCKDCGFLETLANTIKNKDDNVKQRMIKMMSLASFAVLSSLFGFYFTMKMGKLLPTNIFYHHQLAQFEISYYNFLGFQKSLFFKPEQIQKFNKKRGMINSTVQYKIDKGDKLLTKGPGSWSSISLMEIILNQK